MLKLGSICLGKSEDPNRNWGLFAETRGFEPPKDLTPYLISSEAHSTGLCDVSNVRAHESYRAHLVL